MVGVEGRDLCSTPDLSAAIVSKDARSLFTARMDFSHALGDLLAESSASTRFTHWSDVLHGGAVTFRAPYGVLPSDGGRVLSRLCF
jgi:hypothetical protein